MFAIMARGHKTEILELFDNFSVRSLKVSIHFEYFTGFAVNSLTGIIDSIRFTHQHIDTFTYLFYSSIVSLNILRENKGMREYRII